MDDYKLNAKYKIVYLLYKVHIHLDYDIDVGDHTIHCMVMENNRYAKNNKDKKNYNEFRLFALKNFQKKFIELIRIQNRIMYCDIYFSYHTR
jgi:hypothetical protein